MKTLVLLLLIIPFINTIGQIDKSMADSLFAQFSKKDPSVAIGLMCNDKIDTYYKGYADIEKGILANENTYYNLDHLTYEITAMGILKLIKDKKLELGTKINTIITGLPAYAESITILNLLQHKSALPHINFDSLIINTPSNIHSIIISTLNSKKPIGVYGKDLTFNYLNYYLLAEIIEKVSAKSYSKFVQTELFLPLGIVKPMFYDNKKLKPNKFTGFYYFSDGKYIKDYSDYQRHLKGVSGVYLTLPDYLKWLQRYKNESIITSTELENIFRIDYRVLKEKNSAIGWAIGFNNGRAYSMISGSSNGATNIVIYSMINNVTVVILSNRGSINHLKSKAFNIGNSCGKYFKIE